jgi:hypothetical protein
VQAQRAGAFFALAAKCLPVPAVLSSSSSLRYAAVAPALSTSTAAPTSTATAGTWSSSNPTDSSTAAAIAAAVAAVRDAPLSSDVAAALLHSPAAAGSISDGIADTATAAVVAVAEGHWRCIVCTRVSAYPDWYDPAKGGRPELRMVVKQGEVDAKKLRAQFTPILSTPKVSASTSSYCCWPVNRSLSNHFGGRVLLVGSASDFYSCKQQCVSNAAVATRSQVLLNPAEALAQLLPQPLSASAAEHTVTLTR